MFDFNASLSDVAPVSPKSLSNDVMRMKKYWIIHGFYLYMLFLLCPLPRLSFVIAVFDFNTSLNAVAPVSLMKLPVYLITKMTVYRCCLHVVSFVFTPEIEFCECWICRQCISEWCYTPITDTFPFWIRIKSELLIDLICVLFFVLTT